MNLLPRGLRNLPLEDQAEEESGISQTEDLVEDGVGVQAETETEQIQDISEGELLQSEADSTVPQKPSSSTKETDTSS